MAIDKPPAVSLTAVLTQYRKVELQSNIPFGVKLDLNTGITAATLDSMIDPSQAPLLHAIATELLKPRRRYDYAFPAIFVDSGQELDFDDMVCVNLPRPRTRLRLAWRIVKAAKRAGYQTTSVVHTHE